MSNTSKYIIMTALVCLSAATALLSFELFLRPTIEEKLIEKAAEKYLEEVMEYAAENSEAITEYAKSKLKLQQEKTAQCNEALYCNEALHFNENSGALSFFDYGQVWYSEPRNESKVVFTHCSHYCYYTVTYTEMPLNFNDFYMVPVADNIYLSYSINRHEMMNFINRY